MNNTHDKANRRQEHADDGITQNPRRRTLLPYLMVSAPQTLVEFGSFPLLHLLPVPSHKTIHFQLPGIRKSLHEVLEEYIQMPWKVLRPLLILLCMTV